ncbi:hypothetical protein D6201_04885 [Aurantiacibacter aquimixticola]|uniref:Asparagine synthetase domain-containing protein n=2 Tax=Aurantiacibacter aquimixticola TaxID=1958945 RepID=A0A419RSK1_9SPHN|nr:hypothetical protein D6201_04885 [Aurantiacibacter aquimixticola]
MLGRYSVALSPDTAWAILPGGQAAIIGDPYDTEIANADIDKIATILASDVEEAADDDPVYPLWLATRRLAGRWIVMTIDKSGMLHLFGDASILFPVFYHSQEQFCASSSLSFLTGKLDVEMTRSAAEFFQSERYYRPDMLSEPSRLTDNTYWRLDSTPYEGISQLVANHSLSSDGTVRRIWPNPQFDEVEPRTVHAAARDAAGRLVNVAKALPTKYDAVRIPLTAGLDSRCLLAIALAADIPFECYTYAPADHGSRGQDFHADLEIAKRISSDFGIIHHEKRMVLSGAMSEADEIFSNVREQISSPTLPREFPLLRELATERKTVFLNGNMAEIGRAHWGYVDWQKATPEILGLVTRAIGHSAAMEPYAPWLQELRGVAQKFSLLDFLYWEDRMGNWQSSFQQQINMIAPILSPFNCHEILCALMAVPFKSRTTGDVQKEIISILEPRLLSYPFNPGGGTLKNRIKDTLKSKVRMISRQNSRLNLLWFKSRPR